MKLTIITINYNNSEGLEKTINSIINQSFSDFEYIVIDGGSKDGSVDIIKKYADKITHWISEPDSGVYNAMNKGIKLAEGEYVLFINSGDVIDSTANIDRVQQILYNTNTDLVYFYLKVVFPDFEEVKGYPTRLGFSYFLKDTLPHPATFIRRDLFSKYGMYSEDMKICSDWAFFMKVVCVYKCSYKRSEDCFSVFYSDGISSLPDNQSVIKKEKNAFIRKHMPLKYFLYQQYLSIRAKIRS